MIKVREITDPVIRDTPVHRLDPRTKLVIMLCMSFLVIALDNEKLLFLLFLIPLFAYPLARLSLNRYRIAFIVIGVGLWGTVFSQALFYQEWPRTILFTLIPIDTPILGRITEGVYIYKEGLSYGLIQGLRFSTMTALGLLFCWTTESRAALLALTSLKVPYGIAFMMVTTLRFFPILLKEVFTVIEAQKLKGCYPFRLQNIFQTALNTLTPIMANSIKRAITLSSSVESRAFNAYPQRTYFRQLSYGISDIGLMVFFAITATSALFIKIIYGMYIREIFYLPYLRWIYELGEIL